MPTPHKWRFWLGAWCLVAIATLVTNPGYILTVPFFPIGLLVWLPHGEERAIEGWMVGAWIVGWIFYILLSVVLFRAKKTGVFFIIYAIFCVLLALNVIGCQRVIQAASGIH